MVTPQQQAEVDLARWQALRAAGLTPDERIERLMSDFFLPPIDLDVRYEDAMRAVTDEMREPANG